ncbi:MULTISPECIES: hypothetical protein [unclassified Gordonia (in: high G+C Gram-positive bacteria)]
MSTERDRTSRDTGGSEGDGDATRVRPPRQIQIAGAVTTAEGVVAVAIAVILVIRAATGHTAAYNGYGTAAWLAIIFGAVIAGGVALMSGRRWGRAISLVAQILLLGVSYYFFTSGVPYIGAPLALITIVVLVLLFHPASLRWISADYVDDGENP